MNDDWWELHIKQLVLPKFCIKRKIAPRWRTCHTADFGQKWPENDARDWSLEELVTQQTLAKCGKKMMPLVRGLCLTADFNQMWSKCPLLEDFVLQRTLTKCGPNCAPHWRTLSHCGLPPNVVQNVPLVGGLYLTVDFDQMWSQHVPLVGGLCHAADFNQMWSKYVCPLTEDFVLLQNLTTYGSTMYSSSKKAGTKQIVL